MYYIIYIYIYIYIYIMCEAEPEAGSWQAEVRSWAASLLAMDCNSKSNH